MDSMMADQNETRRRAPMPAPRPRTETTADRSSDELSIFSAPGMEVVMQWWVESNARWSRQAFGTVAPTAR